jgi:predicted AAA+ superfamily ATPase
MFHRELRPVSDESFFLFGARGTGKSTWLEQNFDRSRCLWLDLLDPDIEDRYLRNPKTLENEINLLLNEKRKPDWVIIDEVQKAPRLLDIVHRLIENKKIRFVLTGSSARKLRRGHANLLGGRAGLFTLYPLTQSELGGAFDLDTVLNWGSLPRIHSANSNSERTRRLRSYCQIYLKEEILVEQLIRNLPPFKGFLEILAQMNGKRLNYESIARDIRADNKTVQAYVDILEETFLGIRLHPFHASIRKSQRQAPKFFWFDSGVQRYLAGSIRSPLVPKTSAYGEAFESWIVNELVRYSSYHELDYQFSYLETRNDLEIDLILKRGKELIAIEIKSALEIDPIEVRKLESLATDLPNHPRIYYLSRNPTRQKLGQVTCLPWPDIYAELK